MHLDRAVDHVAEHPGCIELEQRDLDARLRAAVDLPLPRPSSAGDTPGSRPPSPRPSSAPSACPRAARRTPPARSRTGTSARTRAASARASASRGGSGPDRAASGRARKASPSPPSVFATGTRTPVYRTSQWVLQPRPACPITGTGRTTSTPAVSAGTRIIVPRRCGSASGSEIAKTMANAAPSAPLENHLCPSIDPLVAVAYGPRPQQRRIRALQPPARSSRRSCARHPRRAVAGSAPSDPPCRTDGGSPRCRRRVPGSRTRAAPYAERPISSFRQA